MSFWNPHCSKIGDPTPTPSEVFHISLTCLASPILVRSYIQEPNPSPIRVLSKADWIAYETSGAWDNIPWNVSNDEEALEDLYGRINSACDELTPWHTSHIIVCILC